MVIIPFKTMLEIFLDGIPRNIGIMTFKHISVESPKTDVEPHSLGSRSPKCFMFVKTNISAVRQDRC